ncbi:MAG: prolipoprotein diacylglyceryl transferase [Phycisphaerales bacterium]|jgi:phosphatidylglycerol:prolipoprotein diacylglycerol transferase
MTPASAAWLPLWLHDLDPVALRLGPATIYWYGVSYVLGFALAYVLLRLAARRGLTPIPGAAIGDVVLFGGIGGVIGGRVGYLLLYQPSLLAEFSGSFPWWAALNIARGGMASHGGMVGVVLGLMLLGRLLRKRAAKEDLPELARVPTLHLVDLACAAAPIGLVCGRLANFVNGELLGKVVASPPYEDGGALPWWSVQFPQEILSRAGTGEVSDRQMQMAAEAVGMSYLELLNPEGMQRFELAYQNMLADLRGGGGGGPAAQQASNFMQGFLNARHPSQLYQALAEGPLLLVALLVVWAKPRLAGVVTAWLMILYGLGRIATEFYRLPDTQFAVARPLGLSRGQWLSVALVVGGFGLLGFVVARAKKKHKLGESVPRFGGWLAPAFAATPQSSHAHRGRAADDDQPK